MICPHCNKEIGEKTFVLHWQGGKTEVVKGLTIEAAFAKSGYGGGAIGALDHYEEVDGEVE